MQNCSSMIGTMLRENSVLLKNESITLRKSITQWIPYCRFCQCICLKWSDAIVKIILLFSTSMGRIGQRNSYTKLIHNTPTC